MCFKIHQNSKTNVEFNFSGVKGGGVPQLQIFGKYPYRMMVWHTESFSTLVQLEIVFKSGELKCEEK